MTPREYDRRRLPAPTKPAGPSRRRGTLSIARGAVRGTVLAAAVVLGLLAPSAATAGWASDCQASWNGTRTLSLWDPRPGPVAPFLSDESEAWGVPTPWDRGSESWLIGVAERSTRSGAVMLQTCTVDDPTGDGRYAPVGPSIAVSRRDRVVAVAIADPWIAWATVAKGGRTDRPVIRMRRIGSRGAVRRTQLGGRLTALVPTVDGDLVTSLLRSGRQRVELRRVGRPTRLLQAPARVSSNPKRGRQPSRVWLWQPRAVAIDVAVDSEGATPQLPAAPRRLVELDRAATDPCGSRPGTIRRARTARLHAMLTSSTGWSNTSGPSSAADVYGLRLCTADGRRSYLGTVAMSDGSSGTDASTADIVGDAVLLATSDFSYAGGSGNFTASGTLILVTDPNDPARRVVRIAQPAFVVRSRSAAAWIEHDGLWIADARGVRHEPGIAGASLDLGEHEVVVGTAAGPQAIPITPLPESDVDVRQPVLRAPVPCTDPEGRHC